MRPGTSAPNERPARVTSSGCTRSGRLRSTSRSCCGFSSPTRPIGDVISGWRCVGRASFTWVARAAGGLPGFRSFPGVPVGARVRPAPVVRRGSAVPGRAADLARGARVGLRGRRHSARRRADPAAASRAAGGGVLRVADRSIHSVLHVERWLGRQGVGDYPDIHRLHRQPRAHRRAHALRPACRLDNPGGGPQVRRRCGGRWCASDRLGTSWCCMRCGWLPSATLRPHANWRPFSALISARGCCGKARCRSDWWARR
jgi:hypothetical protein